MQSDVRTCNNHTGIRSVSLTAHHIRDSHKTESKSEWEITEKQAEEAISKWSASAPPTESLFLKWLWASVHAVDGCVCLWSPSVIFRKWERWAFPRQRTKHILKRCSMLWILVYSLKKGTQLANILKARVWELSLKWKNDRPSQIHYFLITQNHVFWW